METSPSETKTPPGLNQAQIIFNYQRSGYKVRWNSKFTSGCRPATISAIALAEPQA